MSMKIIAFVCTLFLIGISVMIGLSHLGIAIQMSHWLWGMLLLWCIFQFTHE